MTNRDELRAAYRRLQNYIQRPTPMSPERDRQALADLQLLGAALASVLEVQPEQAVLLDVPRRRIHR